MSASIGSFAASRLALQNTLEVQTRAEEARIQLSSGKAARTFDGIAEDTRRLQDLETDRAANKAFQNNVEQAELRLNETENTINDLEGIASRFQQQLVAANTDTNPDRLAIQNTAENFRQEIQGLLNEDIAGRSIFGGSATDREPIEFTDNSGDELGFRADETGGTPQQDIQSGAYFKGNDDQVDVRATERLDVQSNISADPDSENGFHKLITATSRVAEADSSDPEALGRAIENALDDLNGGQVQRGGQEVQNPGVTLDNLQDPSSSNIGVGSGTGTLELEKADGRSATVSFDTNADSLQQLANGINATDVANASLDRGPGGTPARLEIRPDGGGELSISETTNTGTTDLLSSLNVGEEQDRGAIQRLADTKSEVGGRLEVLENTQQRLERNDSQLETAIGDIENVDITRAATEMSALQNTLQASFAATSRLEQISILNFLR